MSITVLFVGNDNTVRDALRSMLAKHSDIELLSESDSRDALSLVQHRPVDVMILDTTLPTLSGIKAAGHMKIQAAGTPVILLSFQADIGYVKNSFSEGISGYLLRECAYEELPEAIRVVAGGSCYLSPQIAETKNNGFVEEICRLNKPD